MMTASALLGFLVYLKFWSNSTIVIMLDPSYAVSLTDIYFSDSKLQTPNLKALGAISSEVNLMTS